jgi:hypothetical protein
MQPAQEDITKQSWCLTPHTNSLAAPPAMKGRYIKTWANFRGSQFTGDEDRDGPQSVGLHTIQLPDVSASLRILLNLVSVKTLNYRIYLQLLFEKSLGTLYLTDPGTAQLV